MEKKIKKTGIESKKVKEMVSGLMKKFEETVLNPNINLNESQSRSFEMAYAGITKMILAEHSKILIQKLNEKVKKEVLKSIGTMPHRINYLDLCIEKTIEEVINSKTNQLQIFRNSFRRRYSLFNQKI
jgi:hypothetical protein